MREMLKKPSSHDVRGYFGENASLLLPLLTAFVVVIVTGSFTRAHASVSSLAVVVGALLGGGLLGERARGARRSGGRSDVVPGRSVIQGLGGRSPKCQPIHIPNRCFFIVTLVIRCRSAISAVTSRRIKQTSGDARRTSAEAAAIAVVVCVAEVGLRISLLDDKIYGHLTFQTADVPLAEVVTKFVNLF